MKVEVATIINAPVERVFEVFSDFQRAEERIEGIKKIEFLEKDGRPEVGMKWRETRVMFGKEATEEMWITAINPPRNYVVEAESHGTHYRSEYTFTEKDGGTEVSLTFEGKPLTFWSGVGAFLGVLFSGSVKKALAADMADLKKVIEGASGAGGVS